MIRVCRNLAALCFLLAVAGAPAKAIAIQGPSANCAVKDYSCDDNNVEFRGCANSCDWLSDHCNWFCGGPPMEFDCWQDLEDATYGYCDCTYACISGGTP